MSRLLVSLLMLVLSAVGAGGAEQHHLVLVSLDALRPDFYLDPSFPAPELRALAAAGSIARAAEPVFPSVTYPDHATIVTGVRPMKHGIGFNALFDPSSGRGRWYEEAADLRASPLWEWARTAGLRTAAVAWPVTLGARIDLLVPERDYYARADPLPLLQRAATPGLFERLGVTPDPEIFKNVLKWDAFLTATAVAMIREARPHLLLLHLVQLDYFQHRGGLDDPAVKTALGRIDAHIGAIRQAVEAAGLAQRTVIIVTGDHGFQDVRRTVYPNTVLARAGLGGCVGTDAPWRASAHISGGAAGVFVNPAGDADAVAAAEAALRKEAGTRYTVLTRADLDALAAMPGAALGLEAAPGYALSGSCGRTIEGTGSGGTHGYLPSRASMATGFIAAGAGIRAGIVLDRIRLVDIAPTAARVLGVTPPAVEGRVLDEILR